MPPRTSPTDSLRVYFIKLLACLIAVGGLGLAGAALVRTNNVYGLTLAGAALAVLAVFVLCRALPVRATPPSALTVPLEENAAMESV